MHTLEDDHHSIFRSFQTVVETMTTTGYGADAPWETPWMNALVVGMQLSGIAIGFFTLRVLIIPLFKRTPVSLADRLTPKDDHVVICEYRQDSELLLDELERLGIDYVLIDSDEDEAKRLSDAGYQAIVGDPEDAETLREASIEDATLAITDAGDRNASVVLNAHALNEDLRVVSLTESSRRNRALERIGVDRVVSPHVLIGRRLAHKATPGAEVPSGTSVGEEVEVGEFLVRRESPLHGVEVRETPFFERPRITLVAGWIDGELRLPPAPTDRLTPNAVLVVAGPPEVIDEARDAVSVPGVLTARDPSEVIVAGTGEGGRAAIDALPDDAAVTAIDVEEREEVDVVGDVGDPETLEAAGIEDATALIVAVDDDATALLAIALARSLAEDVEILARVTEDGQVRTAFEAGADYALSIQRATARLLARDVHGEETVSPVGQVRLVRTDGDPFAGRTLEDANAGGETDLDRDADWVVVGVERDGAFRTDASTEIEADDVVVIAGTDESVGELERTVAT
ncbi:NAD-binding protein [Natrialbaceae archaeon GCM10025810]|uniref:NAD-binding protein n=1 Tax=Halovalidus salilacus TaxID=3075124 RepID=UPI0036232AE1